MPKPTNEISALTRTYDLLLWIIPALEKFPKSQKFLLGDRIETLLLDIIPRSHAPAWERIQE